jgi:hypothetical protein
VQVDNLMLATHGLIDSFVDYSLPTKQLVLLFDSLVYVREHLDDQIGSATDFLILDQLREQRIVQCVTLTAGPEDEPPWFGFDEARDLWMRKPVGPVVEPAEYLRALRGALAAAHGIDAVPVLRRPGDWGSMRHGLQSEPQVDVTEIVLSAVPVPAESTTWQQVLEFRSDPEARTRLLALRRWIRRLATEGRPPSEIREELEYLLNEYRSHMDLHRMKWRVGTLESVLALTAEALEGIVRLQPSKLVSALFGVKHRRIALTEAERSAPGREVAYVLEVQQRLASDG